MIREPTHFELVTAHQLCLDRNRDEPNSEDLQDAIEMAARWNTKRKAMGLEPWI